MAQQRVYLTELAPELLIHIARQLDVKDILSVVLLNRQFHRLLFDHLFDQKLNHGTEYACYNLLQHALRLDSLRIVNYIKDRRNEEVFDHRSNFRFYQALSADAPRITGWLLESGALKTNLDDKKYPKLIPLCLTLSKGNASTQEELDASLGTACTYLLPRTAELLLERGANPKARTSNGMTALGCLLQAPDHLFQLQSYGERYKAYNIGNIETLMANVATRMVRILTHILDPHETGCIFSDRRLCLADCQADSNPTTAVPIIPKRPKSHPVKNARAKFEAWLQKRKRLDSGDSKKAGELFLNYRTSFTWKADPLRSFKLMSLLRGSAPEKQA